MKGFLTFLSVLALLAADPTPAACQTPLTVPSDISLTAFVYDEAGRPLSGATVDLVEYGLQAMTDQSGRATLSFTTVDSSLFMRVTGPPTQPGDPLSWNYVPEARFEEILPPQFSSRNQRPSRSGQLRLDSNGKAFASFHLKSLGDWITPPIDGQGGFFSGGAFFVNVPAGVFSETVQLALTLVPPQATTLPDDFSQPGWSLENVGQLELTVLDSSGRILPPVTVTSPIEVGVFDPNLHEDRDSNGTFETFCGLNVEELTHLQGPLEAAYLDSFSRPVPVSTALYSTSSGYLVYQATRSGSWVVRGSITPPSGASGSQAGAEEKEECDGPTRIDVVLEAREKGRSTIKCGGSSGTASYQWSAGSEVTWEVKGEVNVRSLGAKLGLQVGAGGKLYRGHGGGATVGNGTYDKCFSGDSVLYVIYKVAKVICGATEKELGRVETEDSTETDFQNVVFPDKDCPGCGGAR